MTNSQLRSLFAICSKIKMVSRKSLSQPFSLLACLLVLLSTSACIQTRTELKEQEEKQVLQKQVKTLQSTTADVNSRFDDIESDLKRNNGKIESVENRISQSSQKQEKSLAALDAKIKEQNEKLAAYHESISKLESQMADLNKQMSDLQEGQKRAASAAAAKVEKDEKDPFASGEENFKKKQWQEAVVDYNKYRKANPKGKQFATATYKIGVALQELGMNEEAKAFFDEVVSRFPKAAEAKKAAGRLKAMKK